MKITVKMSGTFKAHFPDYDSRQGLDVELPDGSNVSDLLSFLGIPDTRGATIIMEGRVLPAGETLTHGSLINLFQIMSGG
jgi:sulfur carrier protein ThiS